MADVELLQGLVVPVHHDLFGLTLIALVHQHGHELRLVQVGGDEHLLPLLDIDAGAGDETGVGTENRLFIGNASLSAKFLLWVLYHRWRDLKSGGTGRSKIIFISLMFL